MAPNMVGCTVEGPMFAYIGLDSWTRYILLDWVDRRIHIPPVFLREPCGLYHQYCKAGKFQSAHFEFAAMGALHADLLWNYTVAQTPSAVVTKAFQTFGCLPLDCT